MIYFVHWGKYGQKDVAAWLIENGANVEIKNNDGWTPLHFAFRFGHNEIAILLAENNANIYAPDRYGEIPLENFSDKNLRIILKNISELPKEFGKIHQFYEEKIKSSLGVNKNIQKYVGIVCINKLVKVLEKKEFDLENAINATETKQLRVQIERVQESIKFFALQQDIKIDSSNFQILEKVDDVNVNDLPENFCLNFNQLQKQIENLSYQFGEHVLVKNKLHKKWKNGVVVSINPFFICVKGYFKNSTKEYKMIHPKNFSWKNNTSPEDDINFSAATTTKNETKNVVVVNDLESSVSVEIEQIHCEIDTVKEKIDRLSREPSLVAQQNQNVKIDGDNYGIVAGGDVNVTHNYSCFPTEDIISQLDELEKQVGELMGVNLDTCSTTTTTVSSKFV